ncbi:MAG: hypothetical protein WDZ61_00675 [Parcubacteria group bacterium]
MPSSAHIFGADSKAKIIRLFVFNTSQSFTPKEISTRAKERPATVRSELRALSKGKLIRKRGKGYTLNSSYPNLPALESFLVDVSPVSHSEIIKKLNKAGMIKLVVIAGVFTHDPESRVDLLIVGDNLKQRTLVSAISAIEAELGRELRYAAFETGDFKYRLSLYDKLIRDILDYPHKKILDKFGI